MLRWSWGSQRKSERRCRTSELDSSYVQVLATVISQAKLVVSEVLEASTTNRYSQTLASLPTVEDLCFSVFFLDEQLPESSEPIPLFERQQVDDLSETLASPMFEPRGMYSATGLEGSLAAR